MIMPLFSIPFKNRDVMGWFFNTSGVQMIHSKTIASQGQLLTDDEIIEEIQQEIVLDLEEETIEPISFEIVEEKPISTLPWIDEVSIPTSISICAKSTLILVSFEGVYCASILDVVKTRSIKKVWGRNRVVLTQLLKNNIKFIWFIL